MVQEAEVNPVVLVKVAKEHQGYRDTVLAAVCEWLNEWEMHSHCNSGSAEQQQQLFATSFCQHLFVSESMKVEKNLIDLFFLCVEILHNCFCYFGSQNDTGMLHLLFPTFWAELFSWGLSHKPWDFTSAASQIIIFISWAFCCLFLFL